MISEYKVVRFVLSFHRCQVSPPRACSRTYSYSDYRDNGLFESRLGNFGAMVVGTARNFCRSDNVIAPVFLWNTSFFRLLGFWGGAVFVVAATDIVATDGSSPLRRLRFVARLLSTPLHPRL